tara:strand:+ start:155 stop:1786 length:1632 start_codon:yes stop_codon:yes gene_type:complete
LSTIVFRCDASNIIGSGHIIRCRTLARELNIRGHEIIFVCRKTKGNLIMLLEKEFRVLELLIEELSVEEQKLIQSKERQDFDNQKLIDYQKKDARLTLKVLSKENIFQPDWIIVDQYELDQCWEKFVKENLRKDITKIMVIDDLANRSHCADLILDQNFVGFKNLGRYDNLVGKNCIKCIGPFYALLGREYSSFKNQKIKKSSNKTINIYFGGNDEKNLTGKILELLTHEEFKDIYVDVVYGLQSEHINQIQNLSKKRKNINLYKPQSSLIKLFLKADLAIGACGSTVWERLFLDLPSLLITIAENQREIARNLAKENFVNLIGDIDNFKLDDIKKIILKTINSKNSFENGKKLVDGFGTKRIAAALVGPHLPIRLREINKSDKYTLFNWINDPVVRESSFNTSLIKIDEHENWFDNGFKNDKRINYIALDSFDCPVGQIRFDSFNFNEYKFNQKLLKNKVFKIIVEIDISIEKCVRGFGLGKFILIEGIEMFLEKFRVNALFVAKIKKHNFPSIKTFLKSDFKEINEQIDKNFRTFVREFYI